MLNKRGEAEGVVAILFLLFCFGAVMLFLFGFRGLGATDGSHNGVVTAVEYNGNIIWDADIVYFKSDAQSTQEDKYCVNDENVKEDLQRYANSRDRVTLYYKNNFIMWAWQCNGGDSIIYKVENQTGVSR